MRRLLVALVGFLCALVELTGQMVQLGAALVGRAARRLEGQAAPVLPPPAPAVVEPTVPFDLPEEEVVPRPRRRRSPRGDGARQRKGWEKRKEAHERATREIEARFPDALALWKETHQLYKGSFEARASAFLEHAEAHGNEVVEAMDRAAEVETSESIAGLMEEYA